MYYTICRNLSTFADIIHGAGCCLNILLLSKVDTLTCIISGFIMPKGSKVFFIPAATVKSSV